jgi:hypothetical protein
VKIRNPVNNGTRIDLDLTDQYPQQTVEIPPPTQNDCSRAARRKVSASKSDVVLPHRLGNICIKINFGREILTAQGKR